MSQEELLMMSQRDRDRVRVIHQVLEGRLSQVDGAERLARTARHVRRLVKRLVAVEGPPSGAAASGTA